MNKQQLVEKMQGFGWAVDRWGHLQKTIIIVHPQKGIPIIKNCRLKMQATSCRVEVRANERNSAGQREWYRVAGSYYKDILILADGRIRIGGWIFGRKN